ILEDARDHRVAAALGEDLGAERDLLDTALDQVVLRHRGEAIEQIALPHRGELLGGKRALAFRNAGDDLFLGAEIAIEVARTHPGLGADLLHRGLVKTRAGKTGLRRGEDLVAAVSLELGIRPAHEIVPRNIIKRTFILRMRTK